ncbi:MAG: heavy metal translocating P-type ATPase [Candidatus Spyradenecus sp.]
MMSPIHTFDPIWEALEAPRTTLLSGLCLAAAIALLYTPLSPLLTPAWASVLLSGAPIFRSAYLALAKGRITSALLISVAMVASMALGEIFAAGEIAFIMALGELLEARTVARARRNLGALLALQPPQARRLTASGAEELVPPEALRPGDLLRVHPGERLPADGVLCEGHAAIDQAPLTGESLPVDKAPGDPLFCGTLNTFGAFTFRVTSAGAGTQLHRLITLLREAENHPAPIQRLADRWASRLVPLAMLLALFGTLGCLLLGQAPLEAIRRGVTVLVVFCPCALVLATPTAIVAAIGLAARRGLLIRNGAALEALGSVRDLAFDKTGTLTTGRLTLTDCLSATPTLSPDALLARAASLEAQSEHPLAKAILAAANARNLPRTPIEHFQALPGRGLLASCGGTPHRCGSPHWFAEEAIPLPTELAQALTRCQREGKATLLLAEGDTPRVCGLLALADAPRPEAPTLLAALKQRGLRAHLLSGDSEPAVATLANTLGLDHFQAACRPEDKVAYLAHLRAQNRPVAMVGDGLNDAPALKSATIGIAMGVSATDLTQSVADITLMQDRLDRLPYLLDLARITTTTIHLNLTAALLINLIAVTLSLAGLLTPVSGALVHNLGSLLVILNAACLGTHRALRRAP